MAPGAGLGAAPKLDGSGLRVAIVHARWHNEIINELVEGAEKSLRDAGVDAANIVRQDVPGSYELPYAVQKVWRASNVQAKAGDDARARLAAIKYQRELVSDFAKAQLQEKAAVGAFDAIIAIGILMKGETMHFEYIADAVSHGLMKVQLDHGVPVIFGLLTVLSEAQARARAGLDGQGHNHGEDWGAAAVELGVKRRLWTEGKLDVEDE